MESSAPTLDPVESAIIQLVESASSIGMAIRIIVMSLPQFAEVDVYRALESLDSKKKLNFRHGTAYPVSVKPKEILFRDVKLGETFEFTMQLYAARAVKACDAELQSIGHLKTPGYKSNFVVTLILPHMKNSIGRKPGDYEWLPDEAIVMVFR